MMVVNEHEITILCPPARVFRRVTDLSTWPQWHGSGTIEQTTPGAIGVGTVWTGISQVQGRTITVTLEVTTFEPDRSFGFDFSGPISGHQSFTFEPVADGTRLVTVLELANPEIAEPARRQWDKDLPILKQLLEGET
jgi:uncharacterized protein YndB with AHSA1/START domain